ncbi:MAG: hypothetical protein AAF908_03675, partial [Pseudomonadota bacterium]
MKAELWGWGRYPRALCWVHAPRDRAELARAVAAGPVIATLANLGAQWAVHQVVPPEPGGAGLAYWTALGFGTGVGLVVKYVLDKRWIF